MTVPYFYRNDNSRFLSVEGQDSSDFLQNLITNDVNKCTKENIIYSCLLSPQGKFMADFFMFKNEEKYIIETHSVFYEKLLKKLSLYKLRSKVLINEITNFYSYSVFGELNNNYNFIIFCADPRNKKIGNKLICKSIELEKLNDFIEIDEKKYHEILIQNTVPLSHFDLEENKSLLLENNFENLNSISWDKGCYVGQEITARMKYRSLLKKQLYALELISGDIEIGDMVLDLGKVVSKANQYIFCMLKIEKAKEKSDQKDFLKIDSSTSLKFL